MAGDDETGQRAPQATVGDVTGGRPGALDFVKRAKYDAWAALRGTSTEDAKRRYTEAVADLS